MKGNIVKKSKPADFELIASGETTEEVNGIVITTDNDGNSFELCDGLRAYLYCPKTTNAANSAITLMIDNAYVYQTLTTAANTTDHRGSILKLTYVDGGWETSTGTCAGGLATINTNMRVKVAGSAPYGDMQGMAINRIKQIKVYLINSAYVLPAGFKYYIYGRRVKNANS